MGRSVIGFKVIFTPRFYFECIFIGVAKESGQTNNITVVSRTADVKKCFHVLERHE